MPAGEVVFLHVVALNFFKLASRKPIRNGLHGLREIGILSCLRQARKLRQKIKSFFRRIAQQHAADLVNHRVAVFTCTIVTIKRINVVVRGLRRFRGVPGIGFAHKLGKESSHYLLLSGGIREQTIRTRVPIPAKEAHLVRALIYAS